MAIQLLFSRITHAVCSFPQQPSSARWSLQSCLWCSRAFADTWRASARVSGRLHLVRSASICHRTHFRLLQLSLTVRAHVDPVPSTLTILLSWLGLEGCDVETAQSLEASTTYQHSQQESSDEAPPLPAGLPDTLPLKRTSGRSQAAIEPADLLLPDLLRLSHVDAEVDSSLMARAASDLCSELLPGRYKDDPILFRFDIEKDETINQPILDFLQHSQTDRWEIYDLAQRERQGVAEYALQAARLAAKHCEQMPLPEHIKRIHSAFATWILRRVQLRYDGPQDCTSVVADQECHAACMLQARPSILLSARLMLL